LFILRLVNLAKLLVLLIFLITVAAASAKSQPTQVAKFKQSGRLNPSVALKHEGFLNAGLEPISAEEAEYVASNGARVMVDIVRFRQDAEAYELLSRVAAAAREKDPKVEIRPEYGTAGFATNDQIAFFRGASFVRIRNFKTNDTSLNAFARDLSEGIDKGEGDIPVLIKHLPAPEEAQKNAVYLNTFADLTQLGLQQPVLSAIESGGNADAVLAAYGPSKMLIVEFNTPQLATENDKRIIARIHELWKLGQPAPTAYRRVGNYSVFVFDAPDEQTAKQLIDQVKYEQVVQWLGDNPYIYKEAEERYINTTLGVLIAVVKASGYALIGCLGIGALMGGLLFSYRRAQQKGVTAFSDAGGMLRLNLDELTPETNPSRLLQDRN
jgi:hypothetical protein